MTAPDVDALEAALRESIARSLAGGSLADWWVGVALSVKQPFLDKADELLDLPAVAPLLAAVRERDALRAAVEGLLRQWRSVEAPLSLQLAGDDLHTLLADVDGGQ